VRLLNRKRKRKTERDSGAVVHTCHPRDGSLNTRIIAQPGLGKKNDSVSKITENDVGAWRVSGSAELASVKP
jgi:hypothetical protein